MATEHHPIRTGIIGTVVGSLIVAGILAVIGKLPALVSYVFGVLGTSIPVPMWMLGVGLAVIGISTKRGLARWIDGSHELVEQASNSKSADGLIREALQDIKEVVEEASTAESINQPMRPVQEPKEPELDEVQQAIMKLFADADTQRFRIGDLYERVPFARLKIDQAVRGLKELGFLRYALSRHGNIHILSAAGTDYIIEQGWAVASKEPELDAVQVENVEAEEYDHEEEEEDWRSYTSDNILDVDWRWSWRGTSIKGLTAHCSHCHCRGRFDKHLTKQRDD